VLEGRLTCEDCGRFYPITRGVPRFVEEPSYAGSFGRQWAWFRTVQLDSVNRRPESDAALAATTGWSAHEYAGRRVLDAGAGAGRFAERAAAMGADVFGIDLSDAIDAAYQNIGHLPNVHLAQADIFALPFRDRTFDLAYAIGVLHHTPDPADAFARVAAAVKENGKLAVYVYSCYGPSYRTSDVIRRVTTRLPLGLMWALSAAAIPLYYVYRLPLIGKTLRLGLPTSIEPDWRARWLDTFDWYTPTYQWKVSYPDVFRWFRAAGFEVVGLMEGPIRACGIRRSDSRERHDQRQRYGSLVAS
jgi:SAM-dependent methyltransferase